MIFKVENVTKNKFVLSKAQNRVINFRNLSRTHLQAIYRTSHKFSYTFEVFFQNLFKRYLKLYTHEIIELKKLYKNILFDLYLPL